MKTSALIAFVVCYLAAIVAMMIAGIAHTPEGTTGDDATPYDWDGRQHEPDPCAPPARAYWLQPTHQLP